MQETMNGTIDPVVPTTMGPVNLDMVERWLEAVILTIFAFLALSGNISLWIIINRSKRLMTNSNGFILCLSGQFKLIYYNVTYTKCLITQGNQLV